MKANLFSGWGASVADAVQQALLLGASLGQSVADIASQVGQALLQPLQQALTIARTEMMNAFRGSSLATMRDEGATAWRWEADHSSNTCAACLAMDGSIHDMSEEMQSHINCRCHARPILPGSDDDYQSGADWFDEQPEDVQREILGPGKLELYQDGMPLTAFVGHSEHGIYEKPLKHLKGAHA